MGIIQPHAAIIVFTMFACAAIALTVALRVKLRGKLERLSRSTQLWVLALVTGCLLATAGIIWMFRRVMHI